MHFFNENEWISLRISLTFVPKGPINNIPALVQVMAWRCPGDKPLSEPMVVSLSTHICVTRPQWVKANVDAKQATSHCLNKRKPISTMLYGATRPHWVKGEIHQIDTQIFKSEFFLNRVKIQCIFLYSDNTLRQWRMICHGCWSPCHNSCHKSESDVSQRHRD